MPPESLRKRIRDDTTAALWSQSSIANGEDVRHDTPWLQPLREVVLGKDKLRGAMARSVAINTQWPQQRLEQAGLVDIRNE